MVFILTNVKLSITLYHIHSSHNPFLLFVDVHNRTVTEPKVNILEGKLIVDWTSTTWLSIFTTLIIHQIFFFYPTSMGGWNSRYSRIENYQTNKLIIKILNKYHYSQSTLTEISFNVRKTNQCKAYFISKLHKIIYIIQKKVAE